MNNNKTAIATYFGGVIGLVTIFLLVWKFVISEQAEPQVIDLMLGVCGTLVSIAVFFVSALFILSARKKKETFESVLSEELAVWHRRNSPLISVENEYVGKSDKDGARYSMLVDHDHILRRAEKLKNVARVTFFDLPNSFKKDDQLVFYLSKKMFLWRAKALGEKDLQHVIDKLGRDIANAISCEFTDIVKAHGFPRQGKNKVTVSFVRDMKTPNDAREIIKLINYVVVLYLAAA